MLRLPVLFEDAAQGRAWQAASVLCFFVVTEKQTPYVVCLYPLLILRES